APEEFRVALVPETVARLVKGGLEVVVASEAGERAGFLDDAYVAAGAQLTDPKALWTAGDLVAKVREPLPDEVALLREGAALVGFLGAAPRPELLERLAARRVTAFALERIPRTTRAQRMDALSSMATVAGYKAALLGAGSLGKFFPLLMTAAGTIPPA